MEAVRIGVIGIGAMGSSHAQKIVQGQAEGATLSAVCDTNPKRLEWARKELPESVRTFDKAEDLYKADCCDAVLIATPHYDHPPLTIAAFQAGLHVLTEKPAGVYTRQVREMNEAADASDKVFAIMFQQRTHSFHQKIKELIDTGVLGSLRRINWLVTTWYRTQMYYHTGGWRATWAGEGGGVLMNQCPHNLDLWQWWFGMPRRVMASCGFGRFHDIEVEDDVHAILEYENGATGAFITTTGEFPGTNRLEVVAENGTLLFERGGDLRWRNVRTPLSEHLCEHDWPFGGPEVWDCTILQADQAKQPGHMEVLSRFCKVIREGGELYADGTEGIKGLELANAMTLSGWQGGQWVSLPIDEEDYYRRLQEKIQNSTYKMEGVIEGIADLKGSF